MNIILKNKSLNKLWRNHETWLALSGYTLLLISVLLLSSCRKEIVFEDDFDEPIFYLNGVIGVGESPEFTVGEVTSAADTFHIDFSCDAAVSLISAESNTIDPVKSADGRCMYMDSFLSIAPQATYTVQANIDGQMLTSKIETPQVNPYDLEVVNVKYLGISTNRSFINGNIIYDSSYLYRVRLDAIYSGDGVPGPYVGFTLEFGSDTALIVDSDIIGRETTRPRTFKKIEELVTDNRENKKLEVVMEIKVPERMDSITIIPMVWTLDKPFYDYLLSYDLHTSSVSDPFSIPARMYSNIDGGVGIFGSYSRSVDTIRVKLPE